MLKYDTPLSDKTKMSFIRSEYDVLGEMMKSSPGCCIVCARKVLEIDGRSLTMRLGRLGNATVADVFSHVTKTHRKKTHIFLRVEEADHSFIQFHPSDMLPSSLIP